MHLENSHTRWRETGVERAPISSQPVSDHCKSFHLNTGCGGRCRLLVACFGGMLSRAPERDSSEGSPGGTAWKVRWRATTRRRFCLQRRNSPGKPEIGAFRRSNVRRRRPPIPETGIALLDRRPSYRPSAASLLPRRSRRLWQPPARGAVGRPRNPRESLPFDMAELIERSISDWYGAQPPGTPSPEV